MLLVFTILSTSTSIAFSQSTDTTQRSATSISSMIAVKGITCSKDLTMISDSIEKLKGVNSCEITKKGATSKFKVRFNPALVSEKEIHGAIESTGSCDNPSERPYEVKKST